MKPMTKIRLIGLAIATVLIVWPGRGQAGVEEEIAGLQKEVAEIKKTLSEIRNRLEAGVKAPTTTSAAVGISGRPSLGRQDAPATLVEFSDYQCPFCKRHFSAVYPIIKKDYIDTGKLRYVFRDFPIVSLHPQAQKAHEAAYCANDQNRYWEMHDILFDNSQDFSIPALKRYAMKIGLNEEQFTACVESGKYAREIAKEISEGTAAGVTGTPEFFIGPSGSGDKITGTLVTGAQPLAKFKQVIDDILKTANQTSSIKPEKEAEKKQSPPAAGFELNPSQHPE